MGKVLIVVDMQRDFVTGVLKASVVEGQDLVGNVVKKVHKAVEEGVEIVYTMDTHGDNYMETSEGKHLPIPHCLVGTDGWKVIPELEDVLTKVGKQYRKTTFGSTDLAEFMQRKAKKLKEKGEVLEVELIGVCTDICVVSNALMIKAFCPEVEVVVDGKCCAGVTVEKHQHALDVMSSCQVRVLNS